MDHRDFGRSYLDPDDPLERELGKAIRMRFPFFYPDYSHTMEESYYANHCESCRALQGELRYRPSLSAFPDSPPQWRLV